MSQNWKNREPDRDQLERHLEHELKKRGLTRRDLVKGGAAMASALGLGALFAACGGGGDSGGEAATTAEAAGTTAPAATTAEGATTAEAAPAFTGTLRVTGLGVDLIDPIKQAGEAALGFKLAFDVTDSVTMVQKAITQPGSFDVFSGYAYQFDQAWPSGNFHNIDISKITRWGEMTPLMTHGYVNPDTAEGEGCSYGDGDAPFRKLYVDPDKSGTWPSSQETPEELQGLIVQWVDETNGQPIGDEPRFTTGPPADFNMDSMGYNGDVIQKEPNEVSWAELLNPEYKGRVSILNDPGIGMQDSALAARALGLMQFGSIGNMTREEIDGLVKILIDRKDQFRAFWTTFDESVNLMASGEVVLESMWSPAVALLVAQGQNVRYAAPPEGFRGWVGNLAISKEAEKDPALLQATYDYINWWHSGEPGAIMMRQGYYNAVMEPSREFVSPAEWDYWIEGKPASEDLPGITGQVGDIKQGEVRDGGSFTDRACNYATWNSYFNESEYQVQRWNEFLAA
jgi:putative spermidine/putrescine transport system substrate-binding protein